MSLQVRRIRPRTRATKRRRPSSASLLSVSSSASAGTAAGFVLRPGFVLGARLVGELGKVEAVHEIAEDGEALLVDHRLGLVLVSGVFVRFGDDAGGLHHLGGDEDRTFDADGQRYGRVRSVVKVEGASG